MNRMMLKPYLALLLFFLFTVQVVAQDNRVTVNLENVSLGEVLSAIEGQTSYRFSYRDVVIGTERNISAISRTNATVSSVLDEVLAGRNLGYNIVSGQSIVIYELRPTTVQNVQATTIQGRVLDVFDAPIIGATIVDRDNPRNGTVTDFDGNYTLSGIPSDGVLVFSFVGMSPQTINLNGRTTIDVIMHEDAEMLEEFVVTALGIRRAQRALSYNVQQVSADDLLTVRDANFVNSLSGRVAGVNINASSSGVGGASSVVMRGARGIASSSQVLFVIDGIPMFNTGGGGDTEFGSRGATEAIADINPDDIESVSVLSGAAAAAMYGSEAANGVILITTRSGRAGYTNVTVSQTTDFLSPFVMPQFQNRYGTGSDGVVTATDRSWGPLLNSANRMGFSPRDDYFRTGVVNNTGVTLTTGTDRNQTFISAAATNSVGMIPNNAYNRYNFTARNTTSLLNDRLSIDFGARFIIQDDRNMTNQGRYQNPIVPTYLFPRGSDWNSIRMFELYNTEREISEQNWPGYSTEFTAQNPYWINHRNVRTNNRDRYMLNAGATFEVVDWLNIAGRVRVDNSSGTFEERLYATTHTTLAGGLGRGFFGTNLDTNRQLYMDLMVNISKQFSHDFSFNANIGASLQDLQNRWREIEGPISANGITNKFNLMNLDNALTRRREGSWREQTQAVFASAEFGYRSAYYLTLTGRNDWPSQLAGVNSMASSFFYPSVGTSFVLSEIFNMPQQISYLQLRGSFASVGTPFPRFLANPVWEHDESSQMWQQKSNYPMSNLKAERTNSWETGISARFLKHFNLDVSLYNTITFNQTFNPQVSVSAGFARLFVQSGRVRNRGVEVSLGYNNNWGDLRWASNYTLSSNQNTILELVRNVPHPETGAILNINRLNVGGLGEARFILTEGGSLGDLYSIVDLRRDDNGFIYVNQHGEMARENRADNPIKLGSVFPKANMAWRNDIGWKNWNAAFMVSARLGGIVYSITQAVSDRYGVSEASAVARDNGGVIINGNDTMDPEVWFSTIGAANGIPQFYTYSATNVRLQEASIGYTFPKSQLWNIAELSVSVVGCNLLMLYNRAPFDPESVATTNNFYQGIDLFMMPSASNVGFNIRARF
ncbi:MAG: SusC/RagA family TonB-linked outer membrane protein [Dysgonamonadaceae bacterium]|jgi:TonB-linked SusC/RagA family outer membrane protein|nr:SusC/RagA family TonB-linked outer membrane protein [Dysgonamonadaceae bacterium]